MAKQEEANEALEEQFYAKYQRFVKEQPGLEEQMKKEEENEEDIPEEARQWKAVYEQDDMEILYDPLYDLKEEAWIKSNLNEESLATGNLSCPYCFVPVAYQYEELTGKYLKDWREQQRKRAGFDSERIKEVVESKQSIYWTKKPLSFKVCMDRCQEREVGYLAKSLSLDETYATLVDMVFEVECSNCDTALGELYSSLGVYLLFNPIDSIS